MKFERAQLTIFIIIAILIIAVVALFFVFKGTLKKSGAVNPESAPIRNFVQECLDDSLENAVEFIGLGGGYYLPEKPRTDSGVKYYIFEEKNYMPVKEKIQDEILNEVKRELILCLGNFTGFPDYQIRKGEIKATSEIREESIHVDVEYPLIIKKGDLTFRIKDFESEVNVNLEKVYNVAKELVDYEINNLKQDPDYGFYKICLGCFSYTAQENNLEIDIQPFEENEEIVFIIRDPQSEVNKKAFELWYANKYRK